MISTYIVRLLGKRVRYGFIRSLCGAVWIQFSNSQHGVRLSCFVTARITSQNRASNGTASDACGNTFSLRITLVKHYFCSCAPPPPIRLCRHLGQKRRWGCGDLRQSRDHLPTAVVAEADVNARGTPSLFPASPRPPAGGSRSPPVVAARTHPFAFVVVAHRR